MWAGVMKIKPRINWHFAKTATSAFACMSIRVSFPIFSLMCACLCVSIACKSALSPVLIACISVMRREQKVLYLHASALTNNQY